MGASEYARIKTKCGQKVGLPGEPVAEKTTLGWTIMSHGRETDSSKMLLTQTSTVDYEELCRLDVLGLEDTAEYDQTQCMLNLRNSSPEIPLVGMKRACLGKVIIQIRQVTSKAALIACGRCYGS